jgi:hypothetical protein
MYQHDFICTYKMMNEQEDQEQLYRIQLLQAFDLEQWNDGKINSILEELLQSLSSSSEFKVLMDKAKENKNFIDVLENVELFDEDVIDDNSNEIIFKMLFTYDYFDLIHRCLCDYLTIKTITQTHLNALINVL